jgi:hypothetical protein
VASRYVLTVKGQPGELLHAAFDDVDVSGAPGVTVLSAELDRAGLHGLLDRIAELGLELLDVRLVADTSSDITPTDVVPTTRRTGMTIGPVEYIIVGFPGNEFTGDIAPALANLIDNKTIRILDLLFIGKDADGDVVAFEYDELEGVSAFSELDGEAGGVISEADIEYAASALAPGSSAALLVWEDLWATEFADALRGSGGVLLEGGRIPHDLAEAALTDLPAAV